MCGVQDAQSGISYLTAQVLGGVLGAALAMFSLPGETLSHICFQVLSVLGGGLIDVAPKAATPTRLWGVPVA